MNKFVNVLYLGSLVGVSLRKRLCTMYMYAGYVVKPTFTLRMLLDEISQAAVCRGLLKAYVCG